MSCMPDGIKIQTLINIVNKLSLKLLWELLRKIFNLVNEILLQKL